MDGGDDLYPDGGEQGMARWLVAVSVAATMLLLLLAAVVLLDLPLPRRPAPAPRILALPVISAQRDAAPLPLPVLTAVPAVAAPFVLRPPAPLIDRSEAVTPGSEAAAIADTSACVALRTGQRRMAFVWGTDCSTSLHSGSPGVPVTNTGGSMLFLVISTPRPERPSEVRSVRQQFWHWIGPLLENGTARFCYPRPGRGAVALFDVDSNETLHRLLNEWAEYIPATFDLYPLIESAQARSYLDLTAE